MTIDELIKYLKPGSKYKLWVYVEEVQEENNHHRDLTIDDIVEAYALGEFKTLQECLKFMISLPTNYGE